MRGGTCHDPIEKHPGGRAIAGEEDSGEIKLRDERNNAGRGKRALEARASDDS